MRILNIFFHTSLLSLLIFSANRASTTENRDAGIQQEASFLQQQLPSQGPQLIVYNRPLAKINGKVFSLIDVIKQMDVDLLDFHLEKPLSPMERYQYYMHRWEAKLDSMIADELILLDAETKEFSVSDGAVHEELEKRFGPTIMTNLHAVHLSYDEALELLKKDLIVREMTGLNVQFPAFQTVTPKLLSKAYQDHLAQNPPEEMYHYQILSIRGEKDELNEEILDKVADLAKQTEEFDQLATELSHLFPSLRISLSSPVSSEITKLSTAYQTVLKELEPTTFSLPICQISRKTKEKVYRIFYLKDHTFQQPPSFALIQEELRRELLNREFERQMDRYILQLKKKFSYDLHEPKLPLEENYQPFGLS